MQAREIKNIVAARPATEGAGVKIKRLTGFAQHLRMDPFLMLDEIHSDNKDEYAAGFPPHPHRGFETVTYMREGGFSHEDSMGNRGSIARGGAQWMTAGSGVIHSEMPVADAESMHGFQFWLNLPAKEKMRKPEYRDIQAEEIAELTQQDARIRLIAGEIVVEAKKIQGAVVGKSTQPLIADVILPAEREITISYSSQIASQFYVYKGAVSVGDKAVSAGSLAYLSEGDSLELKAGADSGLLLFGGEPINEPVAHYGPFVMTTDEQIAQAVEDYRSGTLVQK